jgi:tellurite resistance protein TerC
MNEITPWPWAGFIVGLLFFLALDLGAFSRPTKPKVARARSFKPSADPNGERCSEGESELRIDNQRPGLAVARFGFKPALVRSAGWLALALLFAVGLASWRGRAEAARFVTAYLLEWSLSLDNILVIALIFAAFHVSPALQHRALMLGVLGALVMRGLMIGVGVALIHQADWILYVFGAFLILAGIKTVFSRRATAKLESHPLVRLVRRFFPVSADFDGTKLVTIVGGRRALTPLALVVLLVESSDLIFALDSVPAVFSVTRNAFILFTSNMLAVLGLRSFYFVLAGALDYFRYLKFGLAVVLMLVGARMLLEPHGAARYWFQCVVPNEACLLAIAGILGAAVALSVAAARREKGDAA